MKPEDGYRIIQIEDRSKIFSAITGLSDHLFDQSLNNPEFITHISEKYAENAVVLAVAKEEDIRGICSFYCNRGEIAFLSMIVINGNDQGKGLGRLLLDRMCSLCREKGIKRIRLEVAGNNETAKRFYQKNGFIPEEESNNSCTLCKELEDRHG